MEHFLISQDERCFVEQLGSLDIMTVTLNVSPTANSTTSKTNTESLKKEARYFIIYFA